jgi:hypothetical protein
VTAPKVPSGGAGIGKEFNGVVVPEYTNQSPLPPGWFWTVQPVKFPASNPPLLIGAAETGVAQSATAEMATTGRAVRMR